MNEPRPSAQISYCKRRTHRAWEQGYKILALMHVKSHKLIELDCYTLTSYPTSTCMIRWFKWFLPIFERASVTSFQVGFVDFWSHTSSVALRHSKSVSLIVKISSSRSSSITSSSPSFCHFGVTVGCSSLRRVSRVRGLTWQAAMV